MRFDWLYTYSRLLDTFVASPDPREHDAALHDAAMSRVAFDCFYETTRVTAAFHKCI